MNVAVINVLAKTKSTGKIAYGLHEHLKKCGHHSILCYGRSDEGVQGEEDIVRFSSNLDNCVHAVCSRFWGDQGMYSVHSTKRLLKLLDEHYVEAVYLLNLHGYYLNFPMLFEYLGRKQVKTLYLMLDEAPFLAKCCFAFSCEKYQTECGPCPQKQEYPKSLFLDRSNRLFHMKKEAYAKVKDITFVGIPYTVARARDSALLRDAKLAELDEAVDLRGTYYPRETEQLRKKLNIPDGNKVILTVSPFSNPRKGGRFFLEAAEKLRERKDITFVHVGFDGDTSLCPPNEIPISYVSDQNELAEFYSMGDLFVCTSLAETVANTCLEALSCGTPILSFNVSGMPYCADSAHGTFVEAGDVDALAQVIASAGKKSQQTVDSCRKYAESRYDAVAYFERLEGLLHQ